MDEAGPKAEVAEEERRQLGPPSDTSLVVGAGPVYRDRAASAYTSATPAGSLAAERKGGEDD